MALKTEYITKKMHINSWGTDLEELGEEKTNHGFAAIVVIDKYNLVNNNIRSEILFIRLPMKLIVLMICH